MDCQSIRFVVVDEMKCTAIFTAIGLRRPLFIGGYLCARMYYYTTRTDGADVRHIVQRSFGSNNFFRCETISSPRGSAHIHSNRFYSDQFSLAIYAMDCVRSQDIHIQMLVRLKGISKNHQKPSIRSVCIRTLFIIICWTHDEHRTLCAKDELK